MTWQRNVQINIVNRDNEHTSIAINLQRKFIDSVKRNGRPELYIVVTVDDAVVLVVAIRIPSISTHCSAQPSTTAETQPYTYAYITFTATAAKILKIIVKDRS